MCHEACFAQLQSEFSQRYLSQLSEGFYTELFKMRYGLKGDGP